MPFQAPCLAIHVTMTYREKLSQDESELLASFGYARAEPKRAPREPHTIVDRC